MIRVFIVTYDNPYDLNECLKILFSSDIVEHNYEVCVINNHSNFHLDHEYRNLKIFHNALRPDFSTGHLARSWNQAIINGFKNLIQPDCNILVTSQDDIAFEADWVKRLVEYHEQYSFITSGHGDAMCSYLPEAIRSIGIWDERFCGIGYQEADYFLRALIYNKMKSSINDPRHGRMLNPIKDKPLVTSFPRNQKRLANHASSRSSAHGVSLNVFRLKYGEQIKPEFWSTDLISNPPRPLLNTFFTYPYFEKNIDDLKGKNYPV